VYKYLAIKISNLYNTTSILVSIVDDIFQAFIIFVSKYLKFFKSVADSKEGRGVTAHLAVLAVLAHGVVT